MATDSKIYAFCEMLWHFFCNKRKVHIQIVVSLVSTMPLHVI